MDVSLVALLVMVPHNLPQNCARSIKSPQVFSAKCDVPVVGVSSLTQATNLAYTGITRGAERMESAAKSAQSGEVVEAAVESKMARAEVEASSEMARAMDETLGSLFDEFA